MSGISRIVQLYHTLLRHLSLLLQIALVADQDDGEIVLVLDAQYLLLEGEDFLEGLFGGDGVDEQEAFSGSHVLLSHGGVFFLAGGIEDV